MINENQHGLAVQPWGVIAPVIAIALLTIGTSLVGDGIARAAAGIDRGAARHERLRSQPLEVEDLRVEVEGAGVNIVDGDLVRRRAPARCSASSASRARARPRSGSRCSATRAAARGSPAGRCGSRPRHSRAPRGRAARAARADRLVRPAGPGAALNPSLRIGRQLEETLVAHGFGSSDEDGREARRDARRGAAARDAAFLRRYPHQLSGGQQQRVGLAMAFACRPRVIVLDEPTTGLDVTTQAHVLDTVRDLCDAHGVAAVYVSHDLAVVATLADRVAVMYERPDRRARPRARALPRGGAPVHAPPDRGDSGDLGPARARRHSRDAAAAGDPAGRLLLRAALHVRVEQACASSRRASIAARSATRCAASEPPRSSRSAPASVARRPHAARPGGDACSVVAGRRRLARRPPGAVSTSASCVAAARVHRARRRVRLGQDDARALHRRAPPQLHRRRSTATAGAWRTTRARRDQETRRQIQYIFQSPYSSLNPRKTIGQIIAQPLRLFFDARPADATSGSSRRSSGCRSAPRSSTRYPHELSGGERQRVAIARALVGRADAARLRRDDLSARRLRPGGDRRPARESCSARRSSALLFVTHNLALIRTIAEEVAVMKRGPDRRGRARSRTCSTPRRRTTRRRCSPTRRASRPRSPPAGRPSEAGAAAGARLRRLGLRARRRRLRAGARGGEGRRGGVRRLRRWAPRRRPVGRGVADDVARAPWRPDTIQLVFSGTKGLVATCLLILVERGLLDLDAPVSRYWPEFAAEGKEAITVAQVASHMAAAAGPPRRLHAGTTCWTGRHHVGAHGRRGAVLGAGDAGRLPRAHLRLALRRARPSCRGPQRLGSASSRTRSRSRSASTSGSACPRSRRDGWRGSWPAADYGITYLGDGPEPLPRGGLRQHHPGWCGLERGERPPRRDPGRERDRRRAVAGPPLRLPRAAAAGSTVSGCSTPSACGAATRSCRAGPARSRAGRTPSASATSCRRS